MRFLKKIVYFASFYDWKRLLQYYVAWLRRIEMGMNSWHDDLSVIESAMLLNKPYNRKPGKDSVSKPDQVWWCSDFNNNKCSMQSVHQKNLNGRVRFVQHICSACWKTPPPPRQKKNNIKTKKKNKKKKKKKRLQHPENSAACPYKTDFQMLKKIRALYT